MKSHGILTFFISIFAHHKIRNEGFIELLFLKIVFYSKKKKRKTRKTRRTCLVPNIIFIFVKNTENTKNTKMMLFMFSKIVINNSFEK